MWFYHSISQVFIVFKYLNSSSIELKYEISTPLIQLPGKKSHDNKILRYLYCFHPFSIQSIDPNKKALLSSIPKSHTLRLTANFPFHTPAYTKVHSYPASARKFQFAYRLLLEYSMRTSIYFPGNPSTRLTPQSTLIIAIHHSYPSANSFQRSII